MAVVMPVFSATAYHIINVPLDVFGVIVLLFNRVVIQSMLSVAVVAQIVHHFNVRHVIVLRRKYFYVAVVFYVHKSIVHVAVV